MDDMAVTIFKALRHMDAEAMDRGGKPTGLNWYGGHYRPQQKKPNTEWCWAERLAELLTAGRCPARTQVHYPGQKERCDVVIGPDHALWLEIKGAWKTYWGKRDGIYQSYLLHPLVAKLIKKNHTVPRDIDRLNWLTRREASEAAMLLVGFDSVEKPMDGDVSQLMKLAGLDNAPWVGASDQWDDRNRPGERVRCWLWRRPVT